MNLTKVMIVEDNRDLRLILQKALTMENCEVSTAPNGAVALSTLRSGQSPDIILLDLMMPIMNGLEFLKVWQKDPVISKIPVMVLSSLTNSDLPTQATEIIKKPFGLDDLLSKIHHICDTASVSSVESVLH